MRHLFVFTFILFLSVSCQRTDRNNEVLSILQEWKNKEIVFPEDMIFLIHGKDTLFEELDYPHDYTIISYIDSTGCTSCRMQFQRWKAFNKEIDSLTNGKSAMYFIMYPKKLKEAIYMLKYNTYDYPVCIDLQDSFNKRNKLPSNDIFHTFLLDKDNRVIAMGNPITNPDIKDLYIKIIKGEKIKARDKELTDIFIENRIIHLDNINIGTEQYTSFNIKNKGSNVLVIEDVIPSCDCIGVQFTKEPIQPNDSTLLKITFTPDTKGSIDKTIMLYSNSINSPIRLRIVGYVY